MQPVTGNNGQNIDGSTYLSTSIFVSYYLLIDCIIVTGKPYTLYQIYGTRLNVLRLSIYASFSVTVKAKENLLCLRPIFKILRREFLLLHDFFMYCHPDLFI